MSDVFCLLKDDENQLFAIPLIMGKQKCYDSWCQKFFVVGQQTLHKHFKFTVVQKVTFENRIKKKHLHSTLLFPKEGVLKLARILKLIPYQS